MSVKYGRDGKSICECPPGENCDPGIQYRGILRTPTIYIACEARCARLNQETYEWLVELAHSTERKKDA